MSHTKFSDDELKLLLEDERNCVRLQKGVKHIGIHPFYLNNVATGIAENLNKLISKYDKSLKGIILAYKKPKLLQSNGTVHNDKGHIFVDVEAEFYVFCPQENSLVKAVVNKTGQDHVGCLTHKAYNISVPKPSNETDWKGRMVKIGDEILIRINFVDMFYIIPYIKGEIMDILVKSIKSEIEDDSGISTNESQPTTKRKSKLVKNKPSFLDKSIKDENGNDSDVPAGKAICRKKSKLNLMFNDYDENIQINKVHDDINVETRILNAKNKFKARRNTIHETIPIAKEVPVKNMSADTKEMLKILKKAKSSDKTSPSPKKSKIKKENNSIVGIREELNQTFKRTKSKSETESSDAEKPEIKVENPKQEKKAKSPRKSKSDSYPVGDGFTNNTPDSKSKPLKKVLEISDNIKSESGLNNNTPKSQSAKKVLESPYDIKLENGFKNDTPDLTSKAVKKPLESSNDIKLEMKTPKRLKSRRTTVAELYPTDNIVHEKKKKNKKHNASLDEDVERENISNSIKSSEKLKKSKKHKSIDLSEDNDILAMKKKLLESVLKEMSPKKSMKDNKITVEESKNKRRLSEVTDEGAVNDSLIKKKRKKDNVDVPLEKEVHSKAKKLDDPDKGTKKKKSKPKKSVTPEKYPSLQLNTPHYIDYVPTNEVSTFHDSISPVKMKDRPNLSSPETKKNTSPVGSEETLPSNTSIDRSSATKKKPKTDRKKRPSGLLSDFHTDLIAKYLKK